jgi:nicotinic acid mononucleotide adenylyltransferase
MQTYAEYLEEAKDKPVVFTFGRFNPITSGHEIMIKDVIKQAKAKGGNALIFTSQTQDKKKNPLSYNDKTKYLKAFWGKIIVKDTKVRTAFEALKYLSDKGYKNVTMVVGSDRVDKFEKNIRPYIKHKDKKKSYEFDHFEVAQAGIKRGKGNEMSASKMRQAATEGDLAYFLKGVPSMAKDRDAKGMYDAVRDGMGIREDWHDTLRHFKEMTFKHDKGTKQKEKWRDVIIPKKLTHAFKRLVHGKKYGKALKIYKEIMKEYEKNPKAVQSPGAMIMNPEGRALQITADIVGISIGELKKVFDRNTRYNSTDYNNPFTDYLKEEITRADLVDVEKFADKIFSKVGIDVEFTRHFLERANDKRNGKSITVAELTRLFKQTYKKYGKKIPKLGPDAQAVLNDTQTDLNLPFVLKWDEKSQEFDLISKTIMRKKDFKTSNPKLKV